MTLLRALLLPAYIACCLLAAASAARVYGPRTVQKSTADRYNATRGGYNSTVGDSGTNCTGYSGSASGCRVKVSSHILTVANLNGSAYSYNATSSGHNASTAQQPLPHQHLFPHGRKCGLEHISHSDKTAAQAVKPNHGIAEGGVSINVQVLYPCPYNADQRSGGSMRYNPRLVTVIG